MIREDFDELLELVDLGEPITFQEFRDAIAWIRDEGTTIYWGSTLDVWLEQIEDLAHAVSG